MGLAVIFLSINISQFLVKEISIILLYEIFFVDTSEYYDSYSNFPIYDDEKCFQEELWGYITLVTSS